MTQLRHRRANFAVTHNRRFGSFVLDGEFRMRRRNFIALLGGAAAAWPFVARAQQAERVRRVGVIMGFAENDEVWQAYLASFRQGLQEFGWTDGRNIRFDYRFTGDSEERMRAMAEEVVGHQPDVILVSTNSVGCDQAM